MRHAWQRPRVLQGEGRLDKPAQATVSELGAKARGPRGQYLGKVRLRFHRWPLGSLVV